MVPHDTRQVRFRVFYRIYRGYKVYRVWGLEFIEAYRGLIEFIIVEFKGFFEFIEFVAWGFLSMEYRVQGL